ncbi:hypothetical protein IL306_005333 [Fusarium sp. DS 682]|nr:hypothetical protein IL306_005333 [Fusarium sp. DS 682]
MHPNLDSESELPYIEPPSNEGLKPIRKPPPYTGTPLVLFLSDIKLFFTNFFYLPYLFIPLAGVVFDLIQCLIQRALLYATQDVRECYILVKNALLDDQKKKVIFILHSQGGIEGGMIIDWLLDEMPLDKMQKLEVYTFGNLANHFSNPYRGNDTRSPVIPHIEHYVNEKDFACRFGVLNFTRHYTQNENRFAGKVFINRGGGHQLNQHYLDDMFPLDKNLQKTRDAREGDFMHRKVRVRKDGTIKETTKAELPAGFIVTSEEGSKDGVMKPDDVPRMGDLSRLWKYRNGQLPDSFKSVLTDGI